MRYSTDLSPRQSARILDNAARASAQILVELAGNTYAPVPGQLVSSDDTVLMACLTRPPIPNVRELIGRYVDVQIFTDPRYYFTTHILRFGNSVEPNQIALHRPDSIQVIQRRRFWRAQLAPSATVSLKWTNTAGETSAENAALLNLSANGLACRLSAESASELYVGDHVEVRFELPHSTLPMKFAACVTNRTPATDDAVILGMQFVLSEDDTHSYAAQRRLRDCLYQNGELSESSAST